MVNTEIIYNTQYECTESQYKKLLSHCNGIVATRVENGKYYFKQMIDRQDYINYVKTILKHENN